MTRPALVTLLTDFGTADYFVGAMKGAILSVNRDALIIDITHEIPAHDIRAAAFTLSAAHKTFPANTIHVAVVDPGVGSARRPILVVAHNQFFVGPDNGLFSFIFERAEDARVFHLTRDNYFRHPVSATFHGRDVFAPIAGALANGVAPIELGNEISDYVRLDQISPQAFADGRIEGAIIHIDRFGNCVTNISARELTPERLARGLRLIVNHHAITSFRRFFAEETTAPGELFAVWGSAGLLEIATFRDSAARLLKAERGHSIMLQDAR